MGFLILTSIVVMIILKIDLLGHEAKKKMYLPGYKGTDIEDARKAINSMMHGWQNVLLFFFFLGVGGTWISQQHGIHGIDNSGFLTLKLLAFLFLHSSWIRFWFNPLFNLSIFSDDKSRSFWEKITFLSDRKGSFDAKVESIFGETGFFILNFLVMAASIVIWLVFFYETA
jgi:hypothetical protein